MSKSARNAHWLVKGVCAGTRNIPVVRVSFLDITCRLLSSHFLFGSNC